MTSENTKRRSRLFSRLMVEHWRTLPLCFVDEMYIPEGSAAAYFKFLKVQRNTRNPWCPYSMACRTIQGS